MSSINVSLSANDRIEIGKGPARALRREGKVPAIIYGRDQETKKISLSEYDLNKLYYKAGYSSLLININIGAENYKVIPRSVELHPVTDRIEHADFMYVASDLQVKVLVHIQFINEDKCIGIKRGGSFNIVKREIELLCFPDKIPNNIEYDILNMDIGQSIHCNDLNIPENSKIIHGEQNFTIATLVGRGTKSADEPTDAAAK